jgi:hypothetical protein
LKKIQGKKKAAVESFNESRKQYMDAQAEKEKPEEPVPIFGDSKKSDDIIFG